VLLEILEQLVLLERVVLGLLAPKDWLVPRVLQERWGRRVLLERRAILERLVPLALLAI
jgi:hypothetical protein